MDYRYEEMVRVADGAAKLRSFTPSTINTVPLVNSFGPWRTRSVRPYLSVSVRSACYERSQSYISFPMTANV